MPRIKDFGIILAIQSIAPVSAKSSHTIPIATSEAYTIEGDQACAIAITARTFIGSIGIGNR